MTELDFDEDLDLEEEDEETRDNATNKQLIKAIADIHAMLKKISKALGAKYPYPSAKYPYPKKAEKSEEEYKKEIEELKTKLAEYERKEKEAKVKELLDLEEEKGLVTKEFRREAFKDYMEFSDKQLEFLIEKTRNLSSGEVKKKSYKAEEPKAAASKDMEKKIAELEQKVKDFEFAGIKGEFYEEAKRELAKLKGEVA